MPDTAAGAMCVIECRLERATPKIADARASVELTSSPLCVRVGPEGAAAGEDGGRREQRDGRSLFKDMCECPRLLRPAILAHLPPLAGQERKGGQPGPCAEQVFGTWPLGLALAGVRTCSRLWAGQPHPDSQHSQSGTEMVAVQRCDCAKRH